MEIFIKKLNLLNFKGIKSLTINFNHNTDISGDNGTGKTTIFDAFLWIMFDKDSSNKSDFNIKTLDEHGKAYNKLDHEVSAVLSIDGSDVYLKKTMREKWVKRRGDASVVFDGHETTYSWNDVPVSQGEYKKKISTIIDEQLFRMLTDPEYFNKLKWQERRNILMGITSKIDDNSIRSAKHDFSELLNQISGKTIEELRKEIVAKKKKIKDELLLIPSRIDEANRSMPEKTDYVQLREVYIGLEKEVDMIDGQIKDKAEINKQANEKKLEIQNKLFGMRTQIQDIEFSVEKTINNEEREAQTASLQLRTNLELCDKAVKNHNLKVEELAKECQEIELRLSELRVSYRKQDEEQLFFTEGEFICPACKRPLDDSDIEQKKNEITISFNTNKSKRLEEINNKGKLIKSQLEEKQKHIELLKDEIVVLVEKFNNASSDYQRSLSQTKQPKLMSDILKTNKEYNDIKANIKELENNTEHAVSNDENLQKAKKDIQNKMIGIKEKIDTEKLAAKLNIRISELSLMEKTMAQEIADLEKTELLVQEFIKAKISLLETSINKKFRYVKFKLFDMQVNGQEVECCDTVINGVPWDDANNAAKINSGLDIINTLGNHYKILAPVFIDNAEAVNKLSDMDCQVIRLMVSKDSQLIIK